MPLPDKTSQLSLDEHKNRTKKVFSEDCDNYISDKTSPFQSETRISKSQQSNQQCNQQSNQLNELGIQEVKNNCE